MFSWKQTKTYVELNCWIKIRHDQNKGGVYLKNIRCSWWVVLLLVSIIQNRIYASYVRLWRGFLCVAKFKSGTFNSTQSNKNGDLPNWDNIEAFDEWNVNTVINNNYIVYGDKDNNNKFRLSRRSHVDDAIVLGNWYSCHSLRMWTEKDENGSNAENKWKKLSEQKPNIFRPAIKLLKG